MLNFMTPVLNIKLTFVSRCSFGYKHPVKPVTPRKATSHLTILLLFNIVLSIALDIQKIRS